MVYLRRMQTRDTIYFNNIYQNYVYGLSAEACAVTARWNWWGAITGPNINGNGDHLSIKTDGQITYAPWLRLPVLFTGTLRFILMNDHKENRMDASLKTPGKMYFESHQTGFPRLDLFGLKNKDPEKECVPPKTAIEHYFDM